MNTNKKRRSRLAKVYTVKIREDITKMIERANHFALAERQVTLQTAIEVANRDLRRTVEMHPDRRAFSALKAVSAHIALASNNKYTSASLSNSDLLPVGHPMSTALHAMTSSALAHAQARWIAADRLIADDARALVASAYSLTPDSFERKHAFARLAATPNTSVPRMLTLDPIIAVGGFGLGGDSSAARSMRAKLQRRDRYGKFAFMGGGFSYNLRGLDGAFTKFGGRVVGAGGDNAVEIEVKGHPTVPNGIYSLPAGKGISSKAWLPESVEVTDSDSSTDLFVDESSLQRLDSPSGWDKQPTEPGAPELWTSKDGYFVTKDGDTLSLNRANSADNSIGEQVASSDSWADIQKAALGDQDDYEKALKEDEAFGPTKAKAPDSKVSTALKAGESPEGWTTKEIASTDGVPTVWRHSSPDGQYFVTEDRDGGLGAKRDKAVEDRVPNFAVVRRNEDGSAGKTVGTYVNTWGGVDSRIKADSMQRAKEAPSAPEANADKHELRQRGDSNIYDYGSGVIVDGVGGVTVQSSDNQSISTIDSPLPKLESIDDAKRAIEDWEANRENRSREKMSDAIGSMIKNNRDAKNSGKTGAQQWKSDTAKFISDFSAPVDAKKYRDAFAKLKERLDSGELSWADGLVEAEKLVPELTGKGSVPERTPQEWSDWANRRHFPGDTEGNKSIDDAAAKAAGSPEAPSAPDFISPEVGLTVLSDGLSKVESALGDIPEEDLDNLDEQDSEALNKVNDLLDSAQEAIDSIDPVGSDTNDLRFDQARADLGEIAEILSESNNGDMQNAGFDLKEKIDEFINLPQIDFGGGRAERASRETPAPKPAAPTAPNTIAKGNGVSISFPLAEYEDDEEFPDQVKRANDLGGFVEIDTTPTLEGADAIVVTFNKPRLTAAEANAFLGDDDTDGAFDARFSGGDDEERSDLFDRLTQGEPGAPEVLNATDVEDAKDIIGNLYEAAMNLGAGEDADPEYAKYIDEDGNIIAGTKVALADGRYAQLEDNEESGDWVLYSADGAELERVDASEDGPERSLFTGGDDGFNATDVEDAKDIIGNLYEAAMDPDSSPEYAKYIDENGNIVAGTRVTLPDGRYAQLEDNDASGDWVLYSADGKELNRVDASEDGPEDVLFTGEPPAGGPTLMPGDDGEPDDAGTRNLPSEQDYMDDPAIDAYIKSMDSYLAEEFDSMFETPDGAYKPDIFGAYEPKGKTIEDSADYTDDPEVLAGMFSDQELVLALRDAVLPLDGEDAPGRGALEFSDGPEFVSAEALYFAIDKKSGKGDMSLASIYDMELDPDREMTNADRIAMFEEDAKIDPLGGDEIAMPTTRDAEVLKAVDRNKEIGKPTKAQVATDLMLSHKEQNQSIIDIADDLIAKQDDGLGYDSFNLQDTLVKYLPWSVSSDSDEREAFSALWGMMMSLDGGASTEELTPESLGDPEAFRTIIYNSLLDIHGGDDTIAMDSYNELIDNFGGMPEFVAGKESIASGKDDLGSGTTAAAFYRLVATSAKPNEKSIYRLVNVKNNDPLLEKYTTEGSLFGIDARSFTSTNIADGSLASSFFIPSDADDSRIIFEIAPGETKSIDASTISWFVGENEHFSFGNFEVVSVRKQKGRLKNDEYIVKIRSTDTKDVAAPTAEGISYSGIEDWKKVGGQMGSNVGGTFEDQDGNQYYVKIPKSPSHAQNESLASALYREAGIEAVEVNLGFSDGELRTISPLIPNSSTDLESRLDDAEYIKKLQEGFAVDAWLANWDVAGLTFDNVITDSNGDPVRVDPGGALMWRAQGAPKGKLFGDKVNEIDSLRDPDLNPTSAEVFGSMTDADISNSAAKLVGITPERIDSIVDSIVTDPNEAATLKERLKKRRNDILKRFAPKDNIFNENTPLPIEEDPNAPQPPSDPNDADAMSNYKDALADYEINKAVSDVWDCPPDGLTAAGDKTCTTPSVDELIDNVNSKADAVGVVDNSETADKILDDIIDFVKQVQSEELKPSTKKRAKEIAEEIAAIREGIADGSITNDQAIARLNTLSDSIPVGGTSDDANTLEVIGETIDDYRRILDGSFEDRPFSPNYPPAGSGSKGYAKDKTTFLTLGMRVRNKWGYAGVVDRYDKNSWQVWVTMDIDPSGQFAPGYKKMSFSTKTLDVIPEGGDDSPWIDLPGTPEGKKPKTGVTPTKVPPKGSPGEKYSKEIADKIAKSGKAAKPPKAEAPSGAPEAPENLNYEIDTGTPKSETPSTISKAEKATGEYAKQNPGSKIYTDSRGGQLWFSAKKGQMGERRIFIHSVFVDEKSRRQGIAADLLDKLANDYFGSQISPGGLTKDGKPFWDWWSSSRGLAELSDPQFPNSRHLMTDEQLAARDEDKNVDGSNFPYDVISTALDSPVKTVEESEVNAVDIDPQWQVMPANKSAKELDSQFEDYYKESKFSIDPLFNEDVTDEQERASSGMMAYQANDYFIINELLRGKITVDEDAYDEDTIDPVEYKATIEKIYSMDMLYKNAPTIPEDMVLYRGVHSSYSDKLMKSYEVGDLFSDAAYSSTTTDLRTAQAWSSSHDADYLPNTPVDKPSGLVIEIVAPAGTRAIYLPAYLGGGVDHADEYEVLLDRGTTFRVIAKTEDAEGVTRALRVAVVDQTKEPIDPNAPWSAPEKETTAPEVAEAPAAPEPTVTIKGKVTETGMPKITVNEPLSFDYTAYKDIPSLTSAIASLSDENIQFSKLRGSSALFDSGDVEDLEVRVEGIVDEQGNEKMRITYKLTSWAGDNLVKSMETEGEWDSANQIEIPVTAVDPKTGAILIKTSVYPQYRGSGTTYTANLGDATVTLRRSSEYEKTSALNNYVTIDLPYDASDDDIKTAMEVGGITDVRPSTTTDFTVLAENRLMSIFGGRTDATKNLKQAAAREKTLTDIESVYGITPADVYVTVGPGGQIETRIPDAVAQKIAEKTGAKYLIHDFSMGGLINMEAVNRGIEDLQMLNPDQRKELLVGGIIDFLTGPRGGGLMATRTRWFNGIPLTGMSSDSDVGTGGADYVFFTPKDSVGHRHNNGVYGNSEAELMFDAAKLYTRLDWYANFVDDYGRRSPKNNLIKSATVGAYEVMFKKRVGLESLQSMAVHRDLRDDILIELDKRGIKEIQGRPVNEVVVVAGAPADPTGTASTAYVPLTALIKDLSNKMLMEKLSYGEQQKYLNSVLEYGYTYPPAKIQVLAAKLDFSSLLTKDENTGTYWYYHADGTRTLVKVEEVQGIVDSLGKEGSDLKVFKQTGFYSMEPVKEALAKYKSGEITAEQFANVILAAQWGPNSWGTLIELNAILKSNPEVWDLFKKIVKGSK